MYICFFERVKKVPKTYLDILCLILFALCFLLIAFLVYSRKKAKKEKDKTRLFLSTAAHDIRSPLTSIKGYCDALLSGDIKGEQAETALSVISAEAARLAAITDRLSRVNEEIVANEEIFGICELFRSIFLSIGRKTELAGISVSYSFGDEDEIYVKADKKLIHEALFNICDNAVKYCDGENICVDVKKEGEKVRISVSNKTADSKFSDYFTPGARGSKKNGGTGLGLYISDKLIKVNKSRLYAEKSGDIITFYFHLPCIYSEE